GGSLAIARGRAARLAPTTLALVAIGWLTLDLVTNAQGLELTRRDPERGFERPSVVEFLRRDAEPFRIDTDTGVWDVWQPNTAMLERLPDVVGGIHPLELADFRRYWSGLGSRSTPLYDLLNARYLIGKKGVPLDRDRFELAYDDDPELSVFRNRRALSRAFLVAGAVAAPDHERAYGLIHEPGFDPRAYAVVEGAAGSDARGPAGEARLLSYRASAIAVEVAPNMPGFLVLSEVWYPGWSATVDGRPAPVVRADYLFRAVPVGPGDRRVELRFEPTGWRLGLAISLAAWAAIAALGLIPARLGR
ncbi:MAG TPA: YfhO family protein, partial [Chloroflexota bacterium]